MLKLRWAIAIAAAAAFTAVPALAGPTPGTVPGATSGKIAYTSTKDGQADIYSMDALGNGVFNLTHDKTIGVRTDVQPVWSPNGDFVAFERQYAKGGADLMVVKPDGKQLHGLMPGVSQGLTNRHPSWSSGNVVYFTSNRDGNFELYSILVSGKGLRQLTYTRPGIENLAPSASRDGKFVVFTQNSVRPFATPPQLYVLNVSNGAIVRLTKNSAGTSNFDPAWSPDGSRIAFTSDRMGATSVWMINADGTHLVRLTHSGPISGSRLQLSSDVSPAFSPDGTRIAFVSTRTGSTEIFTMGVPAGSLVQPVVQPVTQLTFDRAYKANPSWQTMPSGPLG